MWMKRKIGEELETDVDMGRMRQQNTYTDKSKKKVTNLIRRY